MNDAQMRAELAKLYPFPKWAEKVKKMSNQQVFATYMRLKREGKI